MLFAGVRLRYLCWGREEHLRNVFFLVDYVFIYSGLGGTEQP